MQKAYSKRNWKNRPNTSTPLGESNLTPMDNAIDEIDNRVVAYDTTKANQSDLLTAFKAVSFDSTTGVFTFTKFNDTTVTVDTDIEKIATNWDYDDDPTSAHYQQIIITLEDGTEKYVDLSALLTQYEFSDSSTIHFSVTNGVVSATVINGSITADHLAPSVMAGINSAVASAEAHAEDSEAWAVGTKDGTAVPSTADQYQNNSKYYAEQADDFSEDSEAYAIGKRDGVDVPNTDPAYHNNSKYWAEQAEASLSNTVRSFNSRTGAVTPSAGDYDLDDMGDVNLTNPTDGQGLRYDSQSGKWVNGDAASAVSNLTDVNLTNLADGEILKYNSSSQKWENKEDSAGHTIQNESGTALTQRSKMQFKGNLKASDDSTNQRTVVDTKQTFAYGAVGSQSGGVYIATASGYELGEGVLQLAFFINVQANADGYIPINVNNQGVKYFRTIKQLSGSELVFIPGDFATFIYDRTSGFFTQIKTGHTLLNPSGTALANRDKIQFPDAHLEDDSANTRTKVEIIKSVTEQQWENVSEGGFYNVDIESVEIGSASDEYVSVTASGDTWRSLLAKLRSASSYDFDKIITESYIFVDGSVYRVFEITDSMITFVNVFNYTSAYIYTIYFTKTGDCTVINWNNSSGSSDKSTDSITDGLVLTLYYGNKYSVIDLQTTANRCLLNNGQNVEQKFATSILTPTAGTDVTGGLWARLSATRQANIVCCNLCPITINKTSGAIVATSMPKPLLVNNEQYVQFPLFSSGGASCGYGRLSYDGQMTFNTTGETNYVFCSFTYVTTD